MKKVFISVALFAACMVSCTTEFENEISEVNNTANVGIFDAEKPVQHKTDYDEFCKAVYAIIDMHIQWDYFRDVLPTNLLARLDSKNYSIDEAVLAIYLWLQNPDTWDVLTEWSVFDIFCANMPDKYLDKYGFYW